MDTATAPFHPINWTFGWWSVLGAFVTGAVIGLWFHKPEFLGGYGSLRRRMLRLGHIAQAALGMMNVLYGLGPWPVPGSTAASIAGPCLIAGAVAMPTVCFLTAWKEHFRHLFAIPVALLGTAVATIALNGGI